jgi:hypothetical protein
MGWPPRGPRDVRRRLHATPACHPGARPIMARTTTSWAWEAEGDWPGVSWWPGEPHNGEARRCGRVLLDSGWAEGEARGRSVPARCSAHLVAGGVPRCDATHPPSRPKPSGRGLRSAQARGKHAHARPRAAHAGLGRASLRVLLEHCVAMGMRQRWNTFWFRRLAKLLLLSLPVEPQGAP